MVVGQAAGKLFMQCHRDESCQYWFIEEDRKTIAIKSADDRTKGSETNIQEDGSNYKVHTKR